MRARARLAVLVAVLVGAGCSKCGQQERAGPVERLLPRGAVAVLVVPSASTLGRRIELLESLKVSKFVAQLQGFPDAKAFSDTLMGQLGFDLRSAEALERAGVDGARALGVAVLITGEVVLALPVKDAGKLHRALESIASQRLGAGAGGEQKTGEVVVKTFSLQQGQPARLGYALAHGYALVGADDAVPRLAALASMSESDSLVADEALKSALGRLPGERDLFLWAPTGSPLLVKAPVTSALVTAALTPGAFTVSVDAPWKGDPAALTVLQPQASGDLSGVLPRDAFLVLRYTGAPAAAAAFAPALLGPHLSAAFAEGGLDLKSEVLDRLKPGVVAALSLADRPPLDRGLPDLDVRHTNPFTYAHLSGAAALTSADGAWPVLEKVAGLAPRFGAQMKETEREGLKALLTTYAQGEGVHFAVKGDRVLFASPVQRLDALVKSEGAGASPVAGLPSDAVSVALDLTRLSQSVRELPESAWGLGGFAIKAATVRWLDATDDLKAITLSVGAQDKSVRAQVVLSLGGAAGRKP